ncbi:LysM peptidoglycan-binding domain-containing protein [Roseovarius sp. MMSF_3281]|uniref:LysM peptidoglycan-binding domain-containing protein n=1 Tax=Roseovarius sp. MMSF_3281 TaxID=3046694 RepID=UPI00273FCF21|nr:LysM domain-containing protein [Roseovarius sp. MMSF_3281]
MIRIVLISVGFISITIALIMMQPSAPRQAGMAAPAAQPDPAVTRQKTDIQTLPQPKVAPERIAPENRDTAARTAQQPRATAETSASSPRPLPAGDTKLETMVVDALKQGQSKDYITALVVDAAEKGKVEVPESLITQDGRVDTSALLANLSQPVQPRHELHTVSPGDTLASISYRYYGRTHHGSEILAANAETLPSEAHLTIGQEIMIPRLQ